MGLPLLLLLLQWLPAMAQQESPCPLNFTILQKYADAFLPQGPGSASPCQFAVRGINLVQSDYLRSSGFFFPPPSSASACWAALQPLLSPIFPDFDPRQACGFSTDSISTGCMNISSRAQFESLAANSSSSALSDVARACTGSMSGSSCAPCTATLTRLGAFLTGPSFSNVSDCTQFPFIYVAGAINSPGPSDLSSADCFFGLTLAPSSIVPPAPPQNPPRKSRAWLFSLAAVSSFLLLSAIASFFLLRTRLKNTKNKKKKKAFPDNPQSSILLDSVGDSTSLVCYSIDEIKSATKNFSRKNIIGKGGYGNVYRGLLPDGTQVALKRFKNCSAAGDDEFRHEVEVIASVRHVNLVGLRGYCIATTALEGHQRIIVCDLMQKGSLHDHLFGRESRDRRLSWPLRRKIAVGTARGIAYLHNSVHPGIIHRDIKASNILLDDDFEPKVADFGLARFAPDGVSHVSTRVAGTLGYVAPEYALYGQLTERSDVYSFGVLLLELLSGRKAINSSGDGDNSLVSDWAWALVREGRALDVIEQGMAELGPSSVLEKYVTVAVLASHPQLYARPLMDQIVKILETDLVAPAIPDRPIPINAKLGDIQRAIDTRGGSGDAPDE
ncbi:receptor-like kinase in in flowers 3 [Wolffia australiana]